jgi:hypothetical protein
MRAPWAKTCAWMVTIAFAGAAWSNGKNFFQDWEVVGNPEYVIFGNVKDNEGQYLGDASVTVRVTEPVLIFRSPTDVLGHYRTLDVGRAIVSLDYEVDPSRIEVNAEYPGYHVISRTYRGKHDQKRGMVEIDFIMAKDAR